MDGEATLATGKLFAHVRCHLLQTPSEPAWTGMLPCWKWASCHAIGGCACKH